MSYVDEILADGPVVYYRLGESSGLPQDSSGNGLHATATLNTPTPLQTGAIIGDSNTAYQFDKNDGFYRSDNALLDVGDVFTLESWVKRGALASADAATIMAKGPGNWQLRFNTDNLFMLLKSQISGVVASTATVTDTTDWHHIVCTKNGSTVKLYLDGVDVTGTVTNATMVNNAENLYVNCRITNDESDAQRLDEIAVYPTALSAARALAHYQAAGYGNGLAWIAA